MIVFQTLAVFEMGKRNNLFEDWSQHRLCLKFGLDRNFEFLSKDLFLKLLGILGGFSVDFLFEIIIPTPQHVGSPKGIKRRTEGRG